MRATEAGHADSQLKSDFSFVTGVGTPVNMREAAKWWNLAAEAWVTGSVQMRKGDDTVDDLVVIKPEAIKWFKRVAQGGDENAQSCLTRLQR